MAQRTRVELFDDLDNGPADETIVFSVDGKTYEIDLSSTHANELRDALSPYVAAGRKVLGGVAKRRSVPGGNSDAGAIRAWANTQGIKVSTRGRVSAEIREAYAKATR